MLSVMVLMAFWLADRAERFATASPPENRRGSYSTVTLLARLRG